MDGLDAIAPETRELSYAGERLVIQPLTVGQIPDVIRKARPVVNSLLALESIEDADEGSLIDLALDLVDKHGDELFAAAALMAGADTALVKRGSIEEFVDLAQALYTVNADFFARRLAPKVAQWRAKRGGGAGKTPSTPSSGPGTP